MHFQFQQPTYLLTKTSFVNDYKTELGRVMPWAQTSANSLLALFAIVAILSMLFRR